MSMCAVHMQVCGVAVHAAAPDGLAQQPQEEWQAQAQAQAIGSACAARAQEAPLRRSPAAAGRVRRLLPHLVAHRWFTERH